ncbi:MAG: YicC family protein [Methylococcales bacterium]|nr:YicC family protein [Methylococcales bacterium]
MIKSMTAFSSGEAELGDLIVSCELRTVNHRYCDLSFKIPERLRFIEGDARSILSGKLSRGKIECSLSYKKQNKEGQGFAVNLEAVAALLKATQQIEHLMQAPARFSALDILALPAIQHEATTDRQVLHNGLVELLQKTLSHLIESREREGRQLAILIEERCIKMQQFVQQAAVRMPEVLQNIRTKLHERVIELVANPDMDRLEQELVHLTQKLDIAEELDRLGTHINEVLRIIKQKEPVGRRLDFLMQEMNREANTLGSKASDIEMTQIAIELKVLIEQVREQIQNIE